MYTGIDGCPSGWIAITLKNKSFDSSILKDAKDIEHIKTDTILIDIPIGLVDTAPFRLCDREARQTLGRGRSSSIFPVPCREAVYSDSYKNACNINYEKTGKKVSKQAYNIMNKIRDVDTLLQNSKSKHILETHPEVCFWALNKKQAMAHYKKTQEGFDERMNTLQRHLPKASNIYNTTRKKYLKKEASDDDIVDALCLAICAKYQKFESLPKIVPFDKMGLPMQILYPKP